jgi:hypothetical protein
MDRDKSKEDVVVYNCLGIGRTGNWVIPNNRRPALARLENLRIEQQADAIYLRDGTQAMARDDTGLFTMPGMGRTIGVVNYSSGDGSVFPISHEILTQTDNSVYKMDPFIPVLVNLAIQPGIVLSTTTDGTVVSNIGDRSYLLNGTPSVYIHGTNRLDVLGTPPPSFSWTSPGVSAFVAPNTVTGYTYAVTYENVNTSYESDYSSLSPLVNIVTNTITQVGFVGGGIGYITRLYRTTDGGSILYLEREILNAVGAISNTSVPPLSDGDLILKKVGSEVGRRALAPDFCKVGCVHNNRLFLAYRRTLFISDAHNGSDVNLGYFPFSNIKHADQVITALHSYNNELYIFTPTSSYVLRGATLSEYRLYKINNLGCNSQGGVVSNSSDMLWVSSEGIMSFNNNFASVSRPVDDILQPFLNLRYARRVQHTSFWNEHERCFTFIIVGIDDNVISWLNEDNNNPISWLDQNTGLPIDWFSEENGDLVRFSVILNYIPHLDSWTTTRYQQEKSFPGSYFVTGCHPPQSQGAGTIQGRHDYLLFFNHQKNYSTFVRTNSFDIPQDEGVNIEFDLVVGPLIPGNNKDSPKFIRAISFATLEESPVKNPQCKAYMLRDRLNPGSIPIEEWTQIPLNPSSIQYVLPQNTCKNVSFRFTGTSAIARDKILTSIALHFRERFYRQGPRV